MQGLVQGFGHLLRLVVGNLFLVVSAAFFTTSAYAHSQDDVAKSSSVPAIRINPQEVNPWTNLVFNNKPENFQFALVGDRTGGMRPGVFADAVKKLNLLQPEFVLSVGDLIEGYTEDRNQVVTEWDEFDAMVKQLDMPFFYVAGNHDITNDMMADVWRERYGKSYYDFVYRDVLFIVLDSMDGERHHIGESQVAWLKGVLEKNPEPRWTLIFVHTPLWDRERSSAWPEIDKLLVGRKHTVFAGHHHRYIKQIRQDNRYFTLATTGGGSGLRGPRYGEFDHVMWVTMTDEGPILANLLLDGIWPDDIRDEPLRNLQRQIIDKGKLSLFPLYHRGDFQAGKTNLRLTNDSDLPYEIALSFEPSEGVSFKGETQRKLTIPPNEVQKVEVEVETSKKTSGDSKIASIDWKLSTLHQGRSIEYEGKEPLNLVRELPIAKLKNIKTDGLLDDWEGVEFRKDVGYAYFDASEWHGESDASFEWAIAETKKHLHFAVRVKDNSIVHDKDQKDWWKRDSLRIQLDARPLAKRAMSRANPVKGEDYYLISMSAPDENNKTHFIKKLHRAPKNLKLKSARIEGGYVHELSIPWSKLKKDAGGKPDGVRVNLFKIDLDEGESGSAALEWQTSWGYHKAVQGAGNFYRQ